MTPLPWHEVLRLRAEPGSAPRPSAPPPPPLPPPPEAPPEVLHLFALLRQARACPHRDPCGCVYANCTRYGLRVEQYQCVRCLQGEPPQSPG